MTEIDWSKAPEGATHWERESYCASAGWMKKDGGVWFFLSSKGRWLMHISYVSADRLQNMVPCPDSSPAWNGEGLPPVGTVCEDDAGNQVVIVAHHSNGVHAIFAESLDAGLLYYGAAGEFRPIRTPEQIAAEEREKAVAAMLELDPYLPNTTLGMMSRADFCRTLYDNNYRKVEGGAP